MGWECMEGVPLGEIPEQNPNRKGFTSWPSFWNSMGKGQKVGEGVHTSVMFM